MKIRIYTLITRGARKGRKGWITWNNCTINEAFYDALEKHHPEWEYYQVFINGRWLEKIFK